MPKKPIAKLKQYPIRIDEKLWRELKGKAGIEGLTIRKILEGLIELYVNGKIEI